MNDERIVKYMKERNDYAQTVACVIAVQLFALAVYFCMYALIAGGVFLSLTLDTGKVIMIVISSAIAAALCVLNILTVIRGKKVYITRPDSIALRDGREVVEMAYKTARPVLIYKITLCLVLLTVSGLVYIMLLTFMETRILAGLYGRIFCCLAGAAAVLIGYPCIDRIACYRALLGESHELSYDIRPNKVFGYMISVTVPVSICVWYVMRYFGDYSHIAWIVFPLVALFALAVVFLAGWTKEE